MDYIQTKLLDYNELYGDGYFFRHLKKLIIANVYFWPLNYYDSKLTLNYRQSYLTCAVSAVFLKLVRVSPSAPIPKEQGEGIHRFPSTDGNETCRNATQVTTEFLVHCLNNCRAVF